MTRQADGCDDMSHGGVVMSGCRPLIKGHRHVNELEAAKRLIAVHAAFPVIPSIAAIASQRR
jgi:hypothetical protein